MHTASDRPPTIGVVHHDFCPGSPSSTDLGAANFSEILELKVVFSYRMLWRMLGPNESLWDDVYRSMHRIRGLLTCNHLPGSLSATVSEDDPLAHVSRATALVQALSHRSSGPTDASRPSCHFAPLEAGAGPASPPQHEYAYPIQN